eukprot:scaffold7525_cov248-Pinguiococcus_pyrenoidosus.AAC.3
MPSVGLDELRSAPAQPRARSRLSDYSIKEMIGEGAYGRVFKAEQKASRRLVALKRIRLDREREGFPLTAFREIRYLLKMKGAIAVESYAQKWLLALWGVGEVEALPDGASVADPKCCLSVLSCVMVDRSPERGGAAGRSCRAGQQQRRRQEQEEDPR